MSARWSFVEFDWERFRAVRATLRRAARTGDFRRVDFPEAAPALEQTDAQWTVEETCNALITALCCVGEPITVERGLPEALRGMRRLRRGEVAAEILGELISAKPGTEEWFEADVGLVGALDAVRTRELSDEIAAFQAASSQSGRSRGFGALAQALRRFAPMEGAEERMKELFELIARSADAGHGVAVLREE